MAKIPSDRGLNGQPGAFPRATPCAQPLPPRAAWPQHPATPLLAHWLQPKLSMGELKLSISTLSLGMVSGTGGLSLPEQRRPPRGPLPALHAGCNASLQRKQGNAAVRPQPGVVHAGPLPSHPLLEAPGSERAPSEPADGYLCFPSSRVHRFLTPLTPRVTRLHNEFSHRSAFY